jgi:Tfp pilus assembly protein PilV
MIRKCRGQKATKGRFTESGFGLVDVVIALVLLVVGLLSAAYVLSSVVKNEVRSSVQTVSTHLAEEKVETLRTLPYEQILASVEHYGQLSDYLQYQRTVTIAENADNSLKNIDIVINHSNGHSFTLSTQLAR